MNVRRSLMLAGLASNFSTAIGFITSMVLARLLLPADVGLYSLTASLVGLVTVIRDFGVSAYVIREPNLDRNKIANAFGLMLVSSWTLAAVVALFRKPLSEFYGEPGMEGLMLILALNFMLIPFGAITLAYLNREMRFGANFVLTASSALVNAAVSIALAKYGFGAFSLAWATLASTFVSVLGSMCFRPAWWPWFPRLRDWREIASLGLPLTGASLVGQMTSSSTDLIVGRILGTDSVALLGKAIVMRSLFEQLVMGAVRVVALPYFSAMQHNGSELKPIYLSSSRLLTGIGWPFFILLTVLADPIILLLFGPNWVAASDLIPWVAMSAIMALPFYLTSSILTSLGMAGTMLRSESILLFAKVLIVTATAPLGLQAVAVALTFVSVGAVLLWGRSLRQAIGLGPMELLRQQVGSASLALMTAMTGSLGNVVADGVSAHPFAHLLIGGAFGVSGWLLAIAVVRHPLGPELIRASRKLMKTRPSR